MSSELITTYPSKLPNFNNGLVEVILENTYTLTYGKKRKSDGSYELYAAIKNNTYPYDIVQDGEKNNINIYKVGGPASALWTLDFTVSGSIQQKKIYLFLSPSTTYVNDQSTLPPDISGSFDSSDISLDADKLTNLNTLYAIIQEIGAFFSPKVSYRKYAIVRSSINGELYQKITDNILDTTSQKDPYEDKINWKSIMKNIDEIINTDTFVDIDSNQAIKGRKTFDIIHKSSASSNPTSLELLCKAEADNIYLKNTEIAKDSRKLAGLESRDVSSGKSVIVATNSNGKIDDSFLPTSIISSVNEKILNVNPSGNVDNITTFATIQDAYNAVSKYIRLSPVRINVADGVYSSSKVGPVLNLNTTYDNSMISIIGNISNPENCVIRFTSSQQGIFFCGKGININGFKLEQHETEKGDSIGINIDYGASIILGSSMIIDGCKYGLYASDLSTVKAEGIKAMNCEYAFVADSSVLNINYATTESCKYGCIAENNSTIYCKGSIFNKGIISTGDTIGYSAYYNSVIRAEETNGICNMDINYKDVSSSGTPNSTNGIIVFS